MLISGNFLSAVFSFSPLATSFPLVASFFLVASFSPEAASSPDASSASFSSTGLRREEKQKAVHVICILS